MCMDNLFPWARKSRARRSTRAWEPVCSKRQSLLPRQTAINVWLSFQLSERGDIILNAASSAGNSILRKRSSENLPNVESLQLVSLSGDPSQGLITSHILSSSLINELELC